MVYEINKFAQDKLTTLQSKIEELQINRKLMREFFLELSNLMYSGMSMGSALSLMSRNSKDSLKHVIDDVIKSMNNKASLVEALEPYKEKMGLSCYYQLKSVKDSVNLVKVMDSIVEQLERNVSNANSIKGALAYPVSVVVILCVIITYALQTVVPQMISQLQQASVDIPKITLIMIQLTDFLGTWGGVVIVFLFVFLFVGKKIKDKKFPLQWDRLKLSIPIVGKLASNSERINFYRAYSATLESGIPEYNAIDSSILVIKNKYLSNAFKLSKKYMVNEGLTLADGLEHYKVIGAFELEMLKVNSFSDKLCETLRKQANILDKENKMLSKTLIDILPLVCILLIGVVFGFFIIAIYMPIISISSISA
jgi:type II secretory pathway component PulF